MTPNILPLLEAWPDLTPDPDAMARVTAVMVAGVAVARPDPAEPGESQFRLLTIMWGAVVVAGYLAWDFCANWLSLHPFWLIFLVVVGVLSLLAPLLLLPVLLGTDSLDRPVAD